MQHMQHMQETSLEDSDDHYKTGRGGRGATSMVTSATGQVYVHFYGDEANAARQNYRPPGDAAAVVLGQSEGLNGSSTAHKLMANRKKELRVSSVNSSTYGQRQKEKKIQSQAQRVAIARQKIKQNEQEVTKLQNEIPKIVDLKAKAAKLTADSISQQLKKSRKTRGVSLADQRRDKSLDTTAQEQNAQKQDRNTEYFAITQGPGGEYLAGYSYDKADIVGSSMEKNSVPAQSSYADMTSYPVIGDSAKVKSPSHTRQAVRPQGVLDLSSSTQPSSRKQDNERPVWMRNFHGDQKAFGGSGMRDIFQG